VKDGRLTCARLRDFRERCLYDGGRRSGVNLSRDASSRHWEEMETRRYVDTDESTVGGITGTYTRDDDGRESSPESDPPVQVHRLKFRG